MPQRNLPAFLDVQDDHPLVAELTSLRAAVERYQRESHSAAVRLQRHSLDSSNAIDRAQHLQRENAVLRAEIAHLRTNPAPPSQTAQQHVSELTLALRHVSDQRTLSEETLLVRTKELAQARAETRRAQIELEHVLADVDTVRAREQAALAREHEMAATVRAADEERRLVDGVVRQYAELVRSLEIRHARRSIQSPADSNSTLAASPDVDDKSSDAALVAALDEGKAGLQRLLQDSNQEATRLQQEISRLHVELETSQRELEATEKSHKDDRAALAKALVDLECIRLDDNTAAKMVSRYMKFSQQSTNNLQSALDTLKSRHAATIATLTAQLASTQLELREARRQGERLRRALDALSEDVSREGYGRRREIALRLHALGREERIVEGLRRWRRWAGESIAHLGSKFPQLSTPAASPIIPPSVPDDKEPLTAKSGDLVASMRDTLERMIYDADDLLHSLDSLPTPNDPSGNTGGAARIMQAEDTARTLLRELQRETDRRMELELHAHSVQPRASIEAKKQRPGGHARSATLPVVPVAKAIAAAKDTKNEDMAGPVGLAPVLSATQSMQSEVSQPPPSPPPKDAPLVPTVFVTDSDARLEPAASTNAQDIPPPHVNTSNVVPESTLDEGIVVNVRTSTELHHPQPISPRVQDPPFITSPTDESPTATSTTDHSLPPREPSPEQPPSLLDDLEHVKHRYDEMTRAFRDCHLALQALHRDLQGPSDTPIDSSSIAVLRTAVERLQDFNEDARVELEIRISDEERLIHGYTALLLLPTATRDANAKAEAARFISGEDERVARALTGFSRKRSEVEHDVAEVKRTLHSLRAGLLDDPAQPSPSPSLLPADASPSRGWSAWAGTLLPSSRPSSPAPPTFGSLMTTPRLRHAGSTASLHASPSPSGSLSQRRVSTPALPLLDAMASPPPLPGTAQSPFARLGLDLKIPMPAQVVLPQTPGAAAAAQVQTRPAQLRPRYSSMFGQASMMGIGGPARSPLMKPATSVAGSPAYRSNDSLSTVASPLHRAASPDSGSESDNTADPDVE